MRASVPTLRVPIHLLILSIYLLRLTIRRAGCAGKPQVEAVYAMKLTPRVTFWIGAASRRLFISLEGRILMALGMVFLTPHERKLVLLRICPMNHRR